MREVEEEMEGEEKKEKVKNGEEKELSYLKIWKSPP